MTSIRTLKLTLVNGEWKRRCFKLLCATSVVSCSLRLRRIHLTAKAQGRNVSLTLRSKPQTQ